MAQTKMITPQSSLLKYDSPILISKTTDINLDELLKVTQLKSSESVISSLNCNHGRKLFQKEPAVLLTLMS